MIAGSSPVEEANGIFVGSIDGQSEPKPLSKTMSRMLYRDGRVVCTGWNPRCSEVRQQETRVARRGIEWLVGWRNNGRELYAIDTNGMLKAIPIDTTVDIQAGDPRSLVSTTGVLTWASYGDGTRFVIGREPMGRPRIPTSLVMNWTAALRE